jgi:hypothetical protein
MKKNHILILLFISNLAFAQKSELSKYTYSAWETNEIMAASNKSGKYGYITQKGKIVIPFIYERSLPIEEQLDNIGFVKKNKKWGAIDMQGNVKIDFLYDSLAFVRKQIRVKKLGKWGAIDANGKEISQFIYDEPYYFESVPETKH